MPGVAPRIAVTGVNGFVGRHVVAAAYEAGIEVVGITPHSIEDDELRRRLASEIVADLTLGWPDIGAVNAVIHLAGLSAVGPSFSSPQDYINTNSAIVTHLCENLLVRGERLPRIVGVSSGAVYAAGNAEPLSEEAAVAASSPYVVSKLLVEHQYDYYRSRGMDVVVGRPFNHIGPGQSAGFLLPDLVASLANLRRNESMTAGNLETARDYTDVRDVADAYLQLALTNSKLAWTYNIASGRSVQGLDMLALAADAMGMTVPPIRIDPRRLRANDVSKVVGDATRLTSDVGWKPQIPIGQSVRDYVRGFIASR